MKFIILALALVAFAGCQSRAMTVAQNKHALIRLNNGEYKWVYAGPCWMDPDTDGP